MSGLIAFLVILGLGIATWLLGRSLFKHLRRVPASFDPPDDGRGTTADGPVPGPLAKR